MAVNKEYILNCEEYRIIIVENDIEKKLNKHNSFVRKRSKLENNQGKLLTDIISYEDRKTIINLVDMNFYIKVDSGYREDKLMVKLTTYNYIDYTDELNTLLKKIYEFNAKTLVIRT